VHGAGVPTAHVDTHKRRVSVWLDAQARTCTRTTAPPNLQARPTDKHAQLTSTPDLLEHARATAGPQLPEPHRAVGGARGDVVNVGVEASAVHVGEVPRQNPQSRRVLHAPHPAQKRPSLLRRRGYQQRGQSRVNGDHGASIRWPVDSMRVGRRGQACRPTWRCGRVTRCRSTVPAVRRPHPLPAHGGHVGHRAIKLRHGAHMGKLWHEEWPTKIDYHDGPAGVGQGQDAQTAELWPR
jgi:hypothetical protein